jgi:hypothetical protein
MTMTTPEPVLRHKRKPGYDRGPDTEINRPYPQIIKYFGGSEADDRTETLHMLDPDETQPLARIQAEAARAEAEQSAEEAALSPPVKRLAYFTAVLLVTSALWALSGVLAYVGWACWTKVL